jgi:hypothetical protein
MLASFASLTGLNSVESKYSYVNTARSSRASEGSDPPSQTAAPVDSSPAVQGPGWIACDVGTPPTKEIRLGALYSEAVLATDGKVCVVANYRFTGGMYQWIEAGPERTWKRVLENITHWQALPEQPA